MKLAFSSYFPVRVEAGDTAVFLADHGIGHLRVVPPANARPPHYDGEYTVTISIGTDEEELYRGDRKACQDVFKAVVSAMGRDDAAVVPASSSGGFWRFLAKPRVSEMAVTGCAAAFIFGAILVTGPRDGRDVSTAGAVPSVSESAAVALRTPPPTAPESIPGADGSPAPQVQIPEVNAGTASVSDVTAPSLDAAPATIPSGDEPAAAQAVSGGVAERMEAASEASSNELDAARAAVAESGPEAASQTLDLMRQAMEAVRGGDKIDPRVLAQLPHEVAAALENAGAILSDEESAALMGQDLSKLVRLPASVVADNRDKDGLPTIPETSFWALTDGMVMTPPPGGGDLRTRKDFDAFGLEG